ncbi:Pentatricopeptide repeat-containing protein [Hibiscus syriacus]|uniref:Pentatricopeptide repeat-containing protein n=1 Tax=Hibiscus syriacus TaxID=106335 RepID=A0A6A2ZPF6_HIBSY|nr:Pentatricopeptide repeat-containing protein [Hibiscus syriacus]
MLEQALVLPDKHTFPFVLKGCDYLSAFSEGKQFGKFSSALNLFREMWKTFDPDGYTLQSVISACAGLGALSLGAWVHAYLLKRISSADGEFQTELDHFHRSSECLYCDMMVTDYKIKPALEHYGCLVDLLARAGFIDEALDLVSTMPLRPDAVIWRSLLDACCKKSGSIELSEELAKQVVESGGGNGVYVLLTRVYASACRSIEINGVTHKLFAGDTSHPQTKEIYHVLEVIDEKLESVGYSPDYPQAPMIVEHNETRQHSLRLHSERLAIALRLLKLQPGMPLRIFKNLKGAFGSRNIRLSVRIGLPECNIT